ncbi:MAG TPA: hypothetical protein VLJ58_09455 [Ramlibacter sp.]|nr:hypothetical protein [Ramlibacter sp.]
MKAQQLRSTAAALCLLLPVSAAFVATPAAAQKRVAAVPTPEIDSLQINADEGLAPGSELEFTLEGTPRGQARVRIVKHNINLVLKETARGVYTASYIVRRNVKIDPASPIRASLSIGNKSASANYTFPSSFAPPPVAVAPPQPPQAPPAPRIERFFAEPVARLEPGTELRFRLAGVPGANASFEIPGVVANVPMREARPGFYEGWYTLRRQDNINPSAPIVATLRMGDRVTTAALNRPLVRDNDAPTIGNLLPRQGESVPAGGPTTISGSFDDAGGRGVDPRSVRIVISGRDVTPDARISPQQFSYRGPLPPGRHTVEVTARDAAGNSAQKSWTFDVGGSSMGAAPALPLQLLSPGNNASIDSGDVRVRGRTAPGAMVRVKVEAISPVFGNRASVAQPVVTETVRADANGDFSFSFGAQRVLPIPGTRFEVSVTADQGGQTAESKLVLFQRG